MYANTNLNATLKYTINKTMMRVELPTPLKPGQQFIFKIDWNYFISNRWDILNANEHESRRRNVVPYVY